MTEWEPATEAEVAMRNALRGADQELYFRILARTELLLPVSSLALSRRAPMGWGTWNSGGRTHVLAFTSLDSMRICLAEHAGSARKIAYHDLANAWPNHEWWLAVNPGLPIEGYLPPWFVGQLARGDVRLPGRTSARARGYDTATNGTPSGNLFTAPARPSASGTATTRIPPTDQQRVPNGVPGPGRVRADQDQTVSVTQAMADARRTATGRASPAGPGRPPTNGFTAAPPAPRSAPDEPIEAELVDIEPPAESAQDGHSSGAVTTTAGGRPTGRGSRRRVFDTTIIDAEIIESTVLGAAALGPRVVNTTAIDASVIDSDVIDATVIESTVVETGTHRISGDLRPSGVEEQTDPTRRATRSRADRISGGIPRTDRAPTEGARSDRTPSDGTHADRVPADGTYVDRAPDTSAGQGSRSTGFFDDGSRRSRRASDRDATPAGTGASRDTSPAGARDTSPASRDAGPAGIDASSDAGTGWSGDAHTDDRTRPVTGRPNRGAHEALTESLFTPASPHPGTTPRDDRDGAGAPGVDERAGAPDPAGTGRRHAASDQVTAPGAWPSGGDAATGRPDRGGRDRAGVWDDLVAPGTPNRTGMAGDPADQTAAFTAATAAGYRTDDTGAQATDGGYADPFATTAPSGPAGFATAGPGTSRPSMPASPATGGPTIPGRDGEPGTVDPGTPAREGEPATVSPRNSIHEGEPTIVGTGSPTRDGGVTTPTSAGEPTASTPADESAAAGEGTQAPPAIPGKPGFTPANDVEAELLVAATAGQTDKFLSTLLLARVLIPIPPGESPDVRPDNPAFPWRREVVDGQPYLVVFTSPERMKEFMGEGVVTATAKFVQLIRYWPDVKWSFAVNPGSPVGATLPGIQVKALSAWADDVGLTDDDPDVEYVEVPAPVSPHMPIIMQKPIAPSQVDYYLERGYDRASGFVHRATEVAHLQTPERVYATLGLSYSGSPFVREASEVFVLRWAAHRPDLYRIPYGGQHEAQMRAMQGWMIERPPFRGNGFAPAEDNEVIAEFKVDSIRLPHGAQMWRLTADGQKTQIAEFDADETRWRPVLGVSGDIAWDPTTPAVATVRSVEARSAASREADPLDPRWRGETAGV